MSARQVRAETPVAFSSLFEPCRYKVRWGGRGSGKSWSVARALILQALQRPLRILCTRELQGSIRESVHHLLSAQIDALGVREAFEVRQGEIVCKNGSQFIFAGLYRNVSQIKSLEDCDICWVEEAEAVTKESWDTLIPTIRKSGSEIWVTFNPRLPSDETYRRFVKHAPEGADVRKVSWRDNPWFNEVLREEMENAKARDHDDYLHVWEGEFRAFADNAVYGKQIREAYDQNRICSLPIEPALEVNTFWDLGRADACAVWFHQRLGAENRFIDYYEARLEEIDHYARMIRDKGYLYGTHFMPHDIEMKMLGFSGRTRRQMFEDAGVRPIRVVPRIHRLQEGIEMTRAVFRSCWFDSKRCEQGIMTLRNYSYTEKPQAGVLSLEPVHDWASHGADAFRQFAQGYRDQRAWATPIAYPSLGAA